MKSRKQKPVPVMIIPQEMPREKPYREPDSHHTHIRQISNGFLINEHGWKDGERFEREFYSKAQPKIGGIKHTRFASEQKGAPAAAPAKTAPAPSSPLVGKADFQKGPSAKELPKKLSARNRDHRLMKVKL